MIWDYLVIYIKSYGSWIWTNDHVNSFKSLILSSWTIYFQPMADFQLGCIPTFLFFPLLYSFVYTIINIWIILKENHARAALQDDVTDPMRHATIKDFQTRLEHLSALKSTDLSNLTFDRAHLNLNILRSTPDSLQLSYKLKMPR